MLTHHELAADMIYPVTFTLSGQYKQVSKQESNRFLGSSFIIVSYPWTCYLILNLAFMFLLNKLLVTVR